VTQWVIACVLDDFGRIGFRRFLVLVGVGRCVAHVFVPVWRYTDGHTVAINSDVSNLSDDVLAGILVQDFDRVSPVTTVPTKFDKNGPKQKW
jgi:hypothetical protein